MKLEVSSDVMAALVAEAAQAHPRECCGVLLGERSRVLEIVPARNVHAAPERHFEIDPEVLIDCHRAARGGGMAVVGYYHSHPFGTAAPSATDRALAPRDGAVWAIIAAGGVLFWRAALAGFAPLPYVVWPR